MSNKNRGDRIQLLSKVVLKNFVPILAPSDRSVLEHLVYACCLEDAPYEVADEAFHRMQESYFDWNEVRVTTISELCESLQNLPDPAAAAVRVKKNLQSLFETRYSFEIDDMIKMNQGKAIAELEKLGGMTKFVLGYVTQNALGGHSIPVSNSIMQVLLATEIVTETEASKGLAPGLERTIAKTKGPSFASCLHQLAVLNLMSPTAKQTKAIMKEAGAVEPPKPKPEPASKKDTSKKEAPKADASPKVKAAPKSKPASSKAPAEPAAATPKKSAKKPPSPKAAANKSKTPAAKSASAKAAGPKSAKSSASKSSVAKKPSGTKSAGSKKTAKKSEAKTTKRKPR